MTGSNMMAFSAPFACVCARYKAALARASRGAPGWLIPGMLLALGCGPAEPAQAPPAPTATAAAAAHDGGAAPAQKPEMKRSQPPRLQQAGPDACRAPDEAGCRVCCERPASGGCTVREWSDAGADSKVQPWYNSTRQADKCPIDCKPCAACSRRDEQLARELLADPLAAKCGDCVGVKPGNDACMAKDSCECFCARSRAARERCPDVFAQSASSD